MTQPSPAASPNARTSPEWAAPKKRERREATPESQRKTLKQLKLDVEKYHRAEDFRDKARAWTDIVATHWGARKAYHTGSRIAARIKRKDGAESWPSYDRLMAETGFGERTISADVRLLHTAGFLKVEYGSGAGIANTYTLCLPPDLDDQIAERLRNYAPFVERAGRQKAAKSDEEGREIMQKRPRKTTPQPSTQNLPIEGVRSSNERQSPSIKTQSRDPSLDAPVPTRPEEEGPHWCARSDAEGQLQVLTDEIKQLKGESGLRWDLDEIQSASTVVDELVEIGRTVEEIIADRSMPRIVRWYAMQGSRTDVDPYSDDDVVEP